MGVVFRKQMILPLLLALLLVSPSVFTGLQLDDYYHWGLVTENSLATPGDDSAGIFKLFTFLDGHPERTQVLVDKGMLPWWTLRDVKYMFWRPLSEITHGIDYLLWPDQPVLMHIHSLVYFALLLLATYGLLQRWLTGRALNWAYWIFCLSYTHGFAAGWLANRNAVLASMFVSLTLYCHDRWRSENLQRFHGLGVLCFVLGLLCGEIGVSGGLFLLAYALCYERRFDNKPFVVRYFQRLMTLFFYGSAGIAWLLLRGLMGYGAEGSGHYVDPTQLGHFIATVSERYLLLMNGLFWSVPPEFASLLGNLLPWIIALIGFGYLAFGVAPLLRAQPLARFSLLAVLLMLLPVCATNPHSRLLMAASIPMVVLIGLYFGIRAEQHSRLAQVLRKGLSVLLVVSLLGLSPLLLVFESVQMKLVMDGILNKGAKALRIEPDQENRIHVILNPPVSSVAGYIQGVRAYHGLNTAQAVIPLVSALGEVDMQIAADGRIDMENPRGLYEASQESLLRAPSRALQPNDTLTVAGIVATVLAVNSDGIPTRVAFQLPANRADYVFHLWHNSEPVQCTLSPPGTRITLTQATESC